MTGTNSGGHAGSPRRSSPWVPTDGIPWCASVPALQVLNLGAPMDVLWMRMSRQPTDPGSNLWPVRYRQNSGFSQSGKIIGRSPTSYRKGRPTNFGNRGCQRFARNWSGWLLFCENRVDELRDWDDIKLLTVAVDRLRRWFRARTAMHRRCRARHVAHRRCGHQSGDSGCGGDGEYPGGKAAAGNGRRGRPGRRCSNGEHFPRAPPSACN